MTRYAHIVGWGMSVPRRVVTNDDLAKTVDTSDQWIASMTGIRERRIAGPDETTASLATEAARQALLLAGLTPPQIDLIIVATSSPEYIFPATACLVQDRLGATRAGAFDLSAACTGFIYALAIATQMIATGSHDRILVIGAETLSRIVNWQDRATCVLFGDGAGAFVLQASSQEGGLLAHTMHSDGSGAGLLSLPGGGSRFPTSRETVEKGLHFVTMNGREVYRFATRVMASATREVARKAGIRLRDVDRIVPHQANLRIIELAAKSLDLPLERFVLNIDRYGNTSTASIPIAVCEAVESGKIQPGNRIVLVGFGAGLTWGSALIEWVSAGRAQQTAWWRSGFFLLRLLARIRSWLLQAERWVGSLFWRD